jgi:hypothetical protein
MLQHGGSISNVIAERFIGKTVSSAFENLRFTSF